MQRIADAVSHWFRAVFRRASVESEMAKEMRLHLEMETENNIGLGMAPAEAKRAAMLAFGGVERTKEAVRDERLTRWAEEIASDLKLALRGFRRAPAFAAGVVTLIALGIGPNAAIFSVVNHLLIEPIPFQDGNRMVDFVATSSGRRIMSSRTKAELELWRDRARAVEAVTLVDGARRYTLGDTTRAPGEQVRGAAIGPGATAFVGMRPLLGRDIEASDTLASAPPVTLISFPLWQRLFGGRADAIGKTIVVNQLGYSVIGVMPDRFAIPFFGDQQLFPVLRGIKPDQTISAIAKLRHGMTTADANGELAGIFPKRDASSLEDVPFVERAVDRVGPETKRTVFLLFGAVALVLIISCANVANLMVARAWTRQREFTIRAAMGARRGRLIRHVLVESLVLAAVGGATGVAVAVATLRLMRTQAALSRTLTGVRLDPAVLFWILGLSVLTGVLFGIAPAIFVSSNRSSDALKAGSRSLAGSVASKRLRGVLVIGEVALSGVLLVASGLLVRTITSMQRADVGFQSTGLYGVPIYLSHKSFPDSSARRALIEQLIQRTRAIPGVRQATIAGNVPPEHFVIIVNQLEIDGAAVLASDSLATSNLAAGRPDFFRVAGIRIVQGRPYASYDLATDRTDQSEVVVNEGFARRFFPSGGAVGARIRWGGPWSTIVGVANDIVVPGAGNEVNAPQFYQAYGAAPYRATVLVRSDLPSATVFASVSAAIRAASPAINIYPLVSSDVSIANWRETRAATLRLIASFSLLALLLAAVGLHATISYSVSQRTREIGIRVALGAQSQNVMAMVMAQGIKLTLAGLALGALGGLWAGRAMRALLYHVAPGDPATLAVVGVLLAAIAVVASYPSARRAVRVDPLEALRAE